MAFCIAAMGAPAPAAADPRPVAILALGDSLTAGYGLAQGDGFVPQLQAWLADHGAAHVTVINAGVSGDTSAAGLARLDWAIGPGVDAAIVELGANDALRGISPVETRANMDAILIRLGERGVAVLISGMIGPRNYGADYKTAFDAIFPELAKEHGALYDRFFLEGVAGDPALNQEDGVHPNPAGVALIVERLGPLALELAARAATIAAE